MFTMYPRIIREFEDDDEPMIYGDQPCPKCNSKDICEITHGYPMDEEKYFKLVAEKKIFSGGFNVNPNSPKKYCNNCQNKWGIVNLEKTDFFDLVHEFNVKVGYSQ